MKQGWKSYRFDEVFDLQMGKTPSRSDSSYWGGTNIWVSIADMNEQKFISCTKESITDEGVIGSGIKVVPKDTVIMSFKLSIGKTCIAATQLYTNEAIMAFITKKEHTISPEFIYYYLRGYKWEGANKAVMGMTLNKKTISESVFSYPPLPEQEKIVSELDCLSGIIEKKKQQLKELDALAQSIFYEMFGNPFKDEKGWGVKKIKEVCIVNPPKKETSKGLSNSDIVSFLPMEDLPIKACYHSPQSTRIFSEVQSSYTCFADNDVLMAKVTPCFENGKIGIAQNLENGVGYGSSEFIVIRTDGTNIIKEYIYFIIQDATFIDNACAQLTGTSGLRRVPKQYVEDCYITIPPLSLQQSFASKIESIEQQKALIKQSIVEVETLFNSRMDYYFN